MVVNLHRQSEVTTESEEKTMQTKWQVELTSKSTSRNPFCDQGGESAINHWGQSYVRRIEICKGLMTSLSVRCVAYCMPIARCKIIDASESIQQIIIWSNLPNEFHCKSAPVKTSYENFLARETEKRCHQHCPKPGWAGRVTQIAEPRATRISNTSLWRRMQLREISETEIAHRKLYSKVPNAKSQLTKETVRLIAMQTETVSNRQIWEMKTGQRKHWASNNQTETSVKRNHTSQVQSWCNARSYANSARIPKPPSKRRRPTHPPNPQHSV